MLALVYAVPSWLKAVLDFLGRLAASLAALGPLGAFLIALLDSFVPLPGGPDLAVVLLSTRSPELAPLVVLAATAGAALGSTLIYLAARQAGVRALRKVSHERRARVENLLGRYDVLAIVAAGVAPPPFPFKAFNLCAGVFRVRVSRFVLAIFLGRGIRFGVEAALAVKYGELAFEKLKANGFAVLLVLMTLALAALLWKRFMPKRGTPDESTSPRE
jgi:membrane protein YqaA with SNARE-associated domain